MSSLLSNTAESFSRKSTLGSVFEKLSFSSSYMRGRWPYKSVRNKKVACSNENTCFDGVSVAQTYSQVTLNAFHCHIFLFHMLCGQVEQMRTITGKPNSLRWHYTFSVPRKLLNEKHDLDTVLVK